ncbi:MAG: hypothetical protein E7391_04125 [Ruminococcaceae bacterium]|nr:hypothetical protein [Oscillospiraceae bacterium]
MINKLTELIKEAMQYAEHRRDIGELYKPYEEYIAEYLIDNNTIVAPCKVGDFVYIDNRCIFSEFTNGYTGYSTCEVISIVRTKKQKLIKITPINAQAQNMRYNLRVPFSAIGKTVFLTKEALKGEGK